MLSHLYGMASESLTTVSNIWAFQMYSRFCQNMPKILMTRLAFAGVLLFFYRNAIFKENDPRLWLVSKLMSHLNCLSWRKHVITGEKSSKIFGWLILCSNLLGGLRDQQGTLWIISNIFFFVMTRLTLMDEAGGGGLVGMCAEFRGFLREAHPVFERAESTSDWSDQLVLSVCLIQRWVCLHDGDPDTKVT